jgi:hypothetical protein
MKLWFLPKKGLAINVYHESCAKEVLSITKVQKILKKLHIQIVCISLSLSKGLENEKSPK